MADAPSGSADICPVHQRLWMEAEESYAGWAIAFAFTGSENLWLISDSNMPTPMWFRESDVTKHRVQ